MESQATELDLSELREVRVALDPYVSVLALVTDALGRKRGAPASLRRHILSSIRPESAQSVLPMVHPGYSVAPDCVTPRNPATETPVGDQLGYLHELPEGALLGDIAQVFGETPPPHWQSAARKPRRWAHTYADAMAGAWRCVLPLWRQAKPLLELEVRRVGAALARGHVGLVLDGLHPASRYTDGALRIRDPQPARFSLGRRKLVLVPMLAGPQALICNFDLEDAAWIGYPLPGADGLLRGQAAPVPRQEALLAALVGPVRARLLRIAGQPLSMGQLAGRVNLPPSAITYHCDRLAAAGLVQRQRRGREVVVSRTSLGDALLDLFSP